MSSSRVSFPIKQEEETIDKIISTAMQTIPYSSIYVIKLET